MLNPNPKKTLILTLNRINMKEKIFKITLGRKLFFIAELNFRLMDGRFDGRGECSMSNLLHSRALIGPRDGWLLTLHGEQRSDLLRTTWKVSVIYFSLGLFRVLRARKMKAQEGGFSIPFLPKLSFEKQDTLLKLCVLSIAAILCKYISCPPNVSSLEWIKFQRLALFWWFTRK